MKKFLNPKFTSPLSTFICRRRYPLIPSSSSSSSYVVSSSSSSLLLQTTISPKFFLPVRSHVSITASQSAYLKSLDCKQVTNTCEGLFKSDEWLYIIRIYELWITYLDSDGKPNKPDVNLYNYYLMANLKMGVSADNLLELIGKLEDDYQILANTVSMNIVLKAISKAEELEVAKDVLKRMLHIGGECSPDDMSYYLVTKMLFFHDKIDDALDCVCMTLSSDKAVSMVSFIQCVKHCILLTRLDTLAFIFQRCKEMVQNKGLCPPWIMSNNILDVALQHGHNELAFYALGFLARWAVRGKAETPPVHYSVDERLVIKALQTAATNFDNRLIVASWCILRFQKKGPSVEAFLSKISAYSSVGNLKMAFTSLHQLESAYGGDSNKEADANIFSPFTSLSPLVVACSKDGFETLDSVYYQLENLSRGEPPYKSVAALNCIILGCAHIGDLHRAIETFKSISDCFGLTPDIHSHNALMYAHGKLKETRGALNVFEKLRGFGLKPNATSYAVLVNAHLTNRDPKAAVSVVDEMVHAGHKPSKQLLEDIRRGCVREFDHESANQVVAYARKFGIRI